jgi:hypothetical protein
MSIKSYETLTDRVTGLFLGHNLSKRKKSIHFNVQSHIQSTAYLGKSAVEYGSADPVIMLLHLASSKKNLDYVVKKDNKANIKNPGLTEFSIASTTIIGGLAGYAGLVETFCGVVEKNPELIRSGLFGLYHSYMFLSYAASQQLSREY